MRLWKESKKIASESTKILGDSGYTGMKKVHKKSSVTLKKKRQKTNKMAT